MTADEYRYAYQREFSLTVRFFLSRGISYDDAVEYVQAAWAKGWERREQLRDQRRITPWIVSIARNLRNTTVKQQLHEMTAAEELSRRHEKDPVGLDIREILERCAPRSRAILEAHYLQGWTVPEIAKAEGISEVAVSGRLTRARTNAKRLSSSRAPRLIRRKIGAGTEREPLNSLCAR